jgi:hypothetical protein
MITVTGRAAITRLLVGIAQDVDMPMHHVVRNVFVPLHEADKAIQLLRWRENESRVDWLVAGEKGVKGLVVLENKWTGAFIGLGVVQTWVVEHDTLERARLPVGFDEQNPVNGEATEKESVIKILKARVVDTTNPAPPLLEEARHISLSIIAPTGCYGDKGTGKVYFKVPGELPYWTRIDPERYALLGVSQAQSMLVPPVTPSDGPIAGSPMEPPTSPLVVDTDATILATPPLVADDAEATILATVQATTLGPPPLPLPSRRAPRVPGAKNLEVFNASVAELTELAKQVTSQSINGVDPYLLFAENRTFTKLAYYRDLMTSTEVDARVVNQLRSKVQTICSEVARLCGKVHLPEHGDVTSYADPRFVEHVINPVFGSFGFVGTAVMDRKKLFWDICLGPDVDGMKAYIAHGSNATETSRKGSDVGGQLFRLLRVHGFLYRPVVNPWFPTKDNVTLASLIGTDSVIIPELFGTLGIVEAIVARLSRAADRSSHEGVNRETVNADVWMGRLLVQRPSNIGFDLWLQDEDEDKDKEAGAGAVDAKDVLEHDGLNFTVIDGLSSLGTAITDAVTMPQRAKQAVTLFWAATILRFGLLDAKGAISNPVAPGSTNWVWSYIPEWNEEEVNHPDPLEPLSWLRQANVTISHLIAVAATWYLLNLDTKTHTSRVIESPHFDRLGRASRKFTVA